MPAFLNPTPPELLTNFLLQIMDHFATYEKASAKLLTPFISEAIGLFQ